MVHSTRPIKLRSKIAPEIFHRAETNDVFSSPVNLRDTTLVKVEVKALGAFCQGTTGGAANSMKVSVSYKYPLLMPFAGQIIGSDTISLTGTATNIILQPPCP